MNVQYFWTFGVVKLAYRGFFFPCHIVMSTPQPKKFYTMSDVTLYNIKYDINRGYFGHSYFMDLTSTMHLMGTLGPL